ncbi:MAG: hypothetical protein GY711_32585 [bacterium]|nr:hypothetical protein [bacterium]
MKLSNTLGLTVAATLVTFAVANNGGESTKPVTGTVTGTVMFEGEKKPEIKPLKISAEQSKGCCAEGDDMNTVDRSLVINDKGGIANVVVTLEAKGAKVEIPEKPFEFDQRNCRFEPHVTIVPAGSTVKFLNSDQVSHNIHTYAAKNDGENQTVAPGGDLMYKLEKAEAVKVACDIHPWMVGWVYVTDGTHWGLSGADGAFELKDVPPGDYRLTIWHEKLGRAKAEVSVGADGSSKPVAVKMGAKKKGGGRRRR